jgi:hypothetical protein
MQASALEMPFVPGFDANLLMRHSFSLPNETHRIRRDTTAEVGGYLISVSHSKPARVKTG